MITLVVLTLISILMVRHKFSVKKFTETWIDLLINLSITKSIPSSIDSSDYISRLVLGPVLVAFFITSVEYCNLILDNQVMKMPDRVIDSWDDLALWKDVGIFGLKYRFMSKFVEQDNDMAKNFKKRFKEMSVDYWLGNEIYRDMATNISQGKAVLVRNKLALIFVLIRMAKRIKDEEPDFLDNIHVSRYGSTDLPYFIRSLNDFHHPFHRDLNKM